MQARVIDIGSLRGPLRVHDLKVWHWFFEALATNQKRCELRFNDRDYQVGDVLLLRCYSPALGTYSGEKLVRFVTHIVHAPAKTGGLQRGWCLMSLGEPAPRAEVRVIHEMERLANEDTPPAGNAGKP